MVEKSWRVWFEDLDGSTDVTDKVFYSERKATDYCDWLSLQKHVAKAYIVESAIETNP